MSEKRTKITMKDLPETERPYEKCELYGAGALSDAELLSIIIKTGSQGRRAIDTAFELLKIDSANEGLEGLVRAESSKLRLIPGIGRVKALQLEAVFELARRISRMSYKKGMSFNNPDTVARYYMTAMRDLTQEELHVMLLDTAGALISEKCVTVGTIDSSLADPRLVFSFALRGGSSGIILIHNHPSGSLEPSKCDIDTTIRMRDAGELLGIELKDHLIIGNMNYLSMKYAGYL